MSDTNFIPNDEIQEILRIGGHDDNCYTDEQVLKMIRHMVGWKCINTGINTHIGYEGVSRNEDLILYLHSLLEKVT